MNLVAINMLSNTIF